MLKINEYLKAINLEKDNFYKELYSGLGFLKKRKNLILNIDDLVKKYNLNNFYEQLEVNYRDYFERRNFYKDRKKIDLVFINDLFGIIEDELYATIDFIQMIYSYKKSNFTDNKLYEFYIQHYPSYWNFMNILCDSTDELLKHIQNAEIKELGEKLWNDFCQKKKMCKRSWILK